MNYPMYNTYSYSPIHQAQTPQTYGQRFAPLMAQNPMQPRFRHFPMNPNPPLPSHGQTNSYDNVIRSAAETLAAFTNPLESTSNNNKKSLSRYAQSHSNRRSTPNSTNNSNNSRLYYCETCRIACGGHATYQAHLNGSKHKKKELTAQTNPTSTTNSFRCELCDVNCTNSDAFKAHLEGSKHEKAMKLYKKLGKTIPSVEPPVNNSTVESSNVVETEKSSTSTEIASKPIGEEYIETTFDDNRKPLMFHCKLCDCKFNDANAKDAHLKGKRHRLSFRKKVNPNFEVETSNKTNNTKQRSTENIEQLSFRPMTKIQSSELDENTKFLMKLHEEIVPSENRLKIIEEVISSVESALKSSSEKIQKSSNFPSPLLGVSRTGTLGKNLLVNSDQDFEIVVPCSEWPKKNLLESLGKMLDENFPEIWQKKLRVSYCEEEEKIEVEASTDEGSMRVSIRLTSTSVQQTEEIDPKTNEPLLRKDFCLDALNSMQSVRWFQNQIAARQHAAALIRCLRYKTKISPMFQFLPSEAIEILVEQALRAFGTASAAFRRLLEYLSSGLILTNGPGLKSCYQTDSSRDLLENLTEQQKNDITFEAQTGLRYFAFGQINRWFNRNSLTDSEKNFPKRSFCDDFDQTLAKRFCVMK